MNKLTRGNVLATIKKLKKMPRPKVAMSAPAVQAICGQNTPNKTNKVADLKATVGRRRAIASASIVPYYTPAEHTQFVLKYEAFVQDYIKNKRSTTKPVVDENATEDLSN